MNIKLIAVGKIKEIYLQNGIDEFLKRIKPFCNLEIKQIKEYNTNDISKNIEQEGKAILTYIQNHDYVITLEIDGKNINSVEFSKLLFDHHIYSDKQIIFVIGGSDGLSDVMKARSDYSLSFSKFTFPHQLMRLILIEQIYRAVMINNNNKYHK